MKSQSDANTQEFAIGSSAMGEYNISFGDVNDDLWKASANEENRVGATAKPEMLNWAIAFDAWWIDDARTEFTGQATEIEWTDSNMSYIPSTDYAQLVSALGLKDDGSVDMSCTDAGLDSKKIQFSLLGENGT